MWCRTQDNSSGVKETEQFEVENSCGVQFKCGPAQSKNKVVKYRRLFIAGLVIDTKLRGLD